MSARRQLNPLSPISPNIIDAKQTSVKVGALNVSHAMDERAQDDGTQGSGSGSLVSGLTALDNDTDDFGHLLRQHARDERFLNDAIRGNGQAFRKARPRPRVGLTLENLERNNGLSHGPTPQNRFSSPGSVSSSDPSDPPLNVPREWGRKGRRRNDWLRRINVTDEASTPVPKAESPDGTVANRTALAGNDSPSNVDWSAAAADVPLPSIENSPLSYRDAKSETPSSTRHHNASLERIREWEMGEDFTVGSVLASTPAAISRNTVLAEIRQREIESVRERVITAIRLDGNHERMPGDRPQRRSVSRSSVTPRQQDSHDVLSQTWIHPAEQEIRLPKRAGAARNKDKSPATASGEGEAASTSPIVVYKSSETVGIIDRGIQAKAQASPQRPGHQRHDSQDLLRRLARATSGSPSPRRNMEAALSNQASRASKEGSPSLEKEQTPAIESGENNDETQEDSRTTQVLRAVDNNGTIGSTAGTQDADQRPADSHDTTESFASAAQSQPADQTPVSSGERLSLRTPVVTGAWVDTPGPQHDHRYTYLSPKPSTKQRSELPQNLNDDPELSNDRDSSNLKEPTQPSRSTKPSPLPPSALAAVVNKAKTNQHQNGSDDILGESTIDSLEEILLPSNSDTTTLDLDEDTLQGLRLLSGKPRTQAEHQRQQEILALQSMNARLRAARTSIRDATRGIKRVEHQVEDVVEESEGEAAQGACKRCGCPAGGRAYSSPFRAVWQGFKGLFYDRKVGRRWGLTWLGLFCILFLSWFFTETVLCNLYCQPRYAHTMVGYGVNPDAPRLPWVTATLLFRPFRWIWKPALGFVHWVFAAIYHAFAEDEGVRRTTMRTTTRVARAAQYTRRVVSQPSVEVEYSMMDDELV